MRVGTELPRAWLETAVHRALVEDVATGDVSAESCVPVEAMARGRMTAKGAGVFCGGPVIVEVFRQVDDRIEVRLLVAEGQAVQPGDVIAEIEGPARGILTGERVALNFAQRMSGTATLTARFVQAVVGTGARIVDTRKTTPGLRVLEKYAVRMGGGHNHRMGLYDAVMVKDNHIAAAGGITAAVRRARAAIPHTMTITVECESLEQVDEALAAGADTVLLDHMDNATRAEAVRRARSQRPTPNAQRPVITEASGEIDLSTVRAAAEAGVDVISVGAITHSAPALDISLRFALDRAGD